MSHTATQDYGALRAITECLLECRKRGLRASEQADAAAVLIELLRAERYGTARARELSHAVLQAVLEAQLRTDRLIAGFQDRQPMLVFVEHLRCWQRAATKD